MARAFDGIGPFSALGAPGEDLPTLGAERSYVADTEWQQKVRELVQSARMVVIRAATSESLIWEMRLVKEILPPEKVVLLMPDDAEAYASFTTIFAKEFEIDLPPFHPQENRSIRAMHTGIIFFGPDWTPQLAPLASRTLLRSTGFAPYFYALYPLYDRLGLPRPKPPLNWASVALLAIVGFFLVILPISLWIEEAFF
jgi:hypothetical protein